MDLAKSKSDRPETENSIVTACADHRAVVITVPFFATTATTVTAALEEVSLLPIHKVVLVYDRKSKMGRSIAESVRDSAPAALAVRGATVSALAADQFDTAPRWRHGLLAAFADPRVGAVLVFPGDLQPVGPSAAPVLAENRKGWQRLLANATPASFRIGDYSCQDSFKTAFDRLFCHPLLGLLFPPLAARLASLGSSKCRSEYFVIGRAVFEYVDSVLPFCFGSDPTPQLCLGALEADRFVVESLHFGAVNDDDAQRKALGLIHQLFRFMSQFVQDRLLRDTRKCRTAEDQIMAARSLLPVLDQVFALTRQAMAAVLVRCEVEATYRPYDDQNRCLASIRPAQYIERRGITTCFEFPAVSSGVTEASVTLRELAAALNVAITAQLIGDASAPLRGPHVGVQWQYRPRMQPHVTAASVVAPTASGLPEQQSPEYRLLLEETDDKLGHIARTLAPFQITFFRLFVGQDGCVTLVGHPDTNAAGEFRETMFEIFGAEQWWRHDAGAGRWWPDSSVAAVIGQFTPDAEQTTSADQADLPFPFALVQDAVDRVSETILKPFPPERRSLSVDRLYRLVYRNRRLDPTTDVVDCVHFPFARPESGGTRWTTRNAI